jgi:signal transduction histidine kinase
LKGEICQLRELLQSLRDFGRSNRLHVESFFLRDLATEIAEPKERDHCHRAITTELEFAPSLPPVLADREHFKRVLLCLCENAAGRMDSGGKLILCGYQSGNDIIIEVKNSGTRVAGGGNLSESFNKINQGLALGLVIARQIVLAHGGNIDYKTDFNEQTTFRIVLPLKPAVAEKAA